MGYLSPTARATLARGDACAPGRQSALTARELDVVRLFAPGIRCDFTLLSADARAFACLAARILERHAIGARSSAACAWSSCLRYACCADSAACSTSRSYSTLKYASETSVMRVCRAFKASASLAIGASTQVFGATHGDGVLYVAVALWGGLIFATVFVLRDYPGGRPFVVVASAHAARNTLASIIL